MRPTITVVISMPTALIIMVRWVVGRLMANV